MLRLLLIEKSDILFSKTAFPGCINTDFYILFFLRKIQCTYTSSITDHTFISALHEIRKQAECIIDLPVKELTVSFTIESYTLPVAIA